MFVRENVTACCVFAPLSNRRWTLRIPNGPRIADTRSPVDAARQKITHNPARVRVCVCVTNDERENERMARKIEKSSRTFALYDIEATTHTGVERSTLSAK